jgi:DNA polymerase III alpha subunit (gram-positive type)
LDYLFFDVETTGLPQNFKAHYSNTKNWPRIVQLSWLTSDKEGNIIQESDNIIDVDFLIPREVSKIHGITNKVAKEKGRPLLEVLNEFLQTMKTSKVIICHNVDFDMPVLQSELFRNGIDADIKKKKFCTMKNTVNYCKLPGFRGYKWPRLDELYRICFSEKLENAHNAIIDVKATHRIFYKLKKDNIISI